MLNLDAATIPDLPVVGRIHGQDFIVERASFQNGTLTLRRGTHGPVDFGVTINFSGAQAEALAAQVISVSTNTDEAARVTLRWDTDVNSGREIHSGHALRLEFGLLTTIICRGKFIFARRMLKKATCSEPSPPRSTSPSPNQNREARCGFRAAYRPDSKCKTCQRPEPAGDLRVNIELLNTGSELMLGRVLNTHQQWLCRRLADLGYVVTRQVAVPDTAVDIQSAVQEALGRADFVIVTGGLGPTSDDLTRDLIAQLLGKKLRLDDAVLDAH